MSNNYPKMPPHLHKGKESKELRKVYQDTRVALAKPDKSLQKSKRRVAEKMFKHMSGKEKEAHVNAGTGRRLSPAEQKFKTRNWTKAEPGRETGMKAQMGRHEENREHQHKFGRAWNE